MGVQGVEGPAGHGLGFVEDGAAKPWSWGLSDPSSSCPKARTIFLYEHMLAGWRGSHRSGCAAAVTRVHLLGRCQGASWAPWAYTLQCSWATHGQHSPEEIPSRPRRVGDAAAAARQPQAACLPAAGARVRCPPARPHAALRT